MIRQGFPRYSQRLKLQIFYCIYDCFYGDFGFRMANPCCQRPLITLQKGTYYIAICALLHCGMYAFALVLQCLTLKKVDS